MEYTPRTVFNTRTELRRAIDQLKSELRARPTSSTLQSSCASLLYVAGYFEQAEEHARRALQFSQSNSVAYDVVGRVLYLKGRFREAVRYFRNIGDAEAVAARTNWRLAQCFLRLNDYARAARVLQNDEVTHPLFSLVQKLAEAPAFQLTGAATAVIPMLLMDPLPVIEISVNGQKTFAFIDTGGPGISVSLEFARKKRFPIISSFKGTYALKDDAPVHALEIDSVSLGGVTLRNLPGFALPGVRPKLGKYRCEACIGTGILNQFLTTVDYPNHRLILSRRKTSATRKKQFGLLGKTELKVRVPFYMASDHYLLARGALNTVDDLTFFVDSGLAAFGQPSQDAPPTQAAFMTWYDVLQEYRINDAEKEPAFPYFYPIESLSLGSLAAHRLCGFVNSREGQRFRLDDVMIDGLVSHAFLRSYAWTIDFDRYEFVFSR